MKRFLQILFLMFFCTAFSTELVVYTYDSFVYGIGKKTVEMFEKENNCDVKLLSFGDAGTVLSKAILEKKNPKADVIVGLNQALMIKAINENLIMRYKSRNLSKIVDKSLVYSDYWGTPYDYGPIAIVYNKDTVKNPPKNFEDLLNFKKDIVIEDPRTSSTGLSFLLWTIAVYGNQYTNYWKKLKNSIKTITPGWDEAFSMLENGEADMMVSYSTDAAYSYYNYGSVKYLPAVMEEGNYAEVEYASIMNGTKNGELAEKFIDFLLSDDFQKEVSTNQWMYPVTNVELDESFIKYAPQINKIIKPSDDDFNNIEEYEKQWIKSVM